MLNNYSDETLRLAARLYYVDGMGQAEVAKFVRVSQAKVSRLLALARERGIVRISVAEYEPRDAALERQLQERFGLKAVAVIKTAEGATGEDARRAVAHFGAEFVTSLIPRGSVVAISGGRTLRELAQNFPEDTGRQITAVQAMGSVDSHIGPVDAFELGRSLARRLGGNFLTINTPAFVPDRKTREAFLQLDQIRAVWQRLAEADVALIGIGTLANSVFVERGVLPAREVIRLQACGAVGEICGRFFDAHGRECASPWRDRVIGIELEHLRRTPQVICAIAGADRAPAITAAVRGGLLKSLAIDVAGARALLAQPSGLPRKSKPKKLLPSLSSTLETRRVST